MQLRVTKIIGLFMFFIQAAIIVNGQGINKLDSAGLKHGYWVEVSPIKTLTALREIFRDSVKNIRSQGHYRHGKKYGIWQYFNHESNSIGVQDIYDQAECIVETVILEPSGIVKSFRSDRLNKVGKSILFDKNGLPELAYISIEDDALGGIGFTTFADSTLRTVSLKTKCGAHFIWKADTNGVMKFDFFEPCVEPYIYDD